MFFFFKTIFIGLLTSTGNASVNTKCIFLSNQQYKTQLTLINLHPNEYRQVLHYYSFAISLGRCVGGCNTLDDLSNTVCFPNKT